MSPIYFLTGASVWISGQYRDLLKQTLQPGDQAALFVFSDIYIYNFLFIFGLSAPAFHQGKNLCACDGKVVETLMKVGELVGVPDCFSVLRKCITASAVISRKCDYAGIFFQRKKIIYPLNKTPFHCVSIKERCRLCSKLAPMS